MARIRCLIVSRLSVGYEEQKGRCAPSSISEGPTAGLSVHEALGLPRTRASNLGDPNVGMIDRQ
jgi:hypothetical protein